MASTLTANKHRIEGRRLFDIHLRSYNDAAFCHARSRVDANRHHSVATSFTPFRLVAPSNFRSRKNFSRTHQIRGGYLFGYNQANGLRIHCCSECFSQVLDRGFLYNIQSGGFDKATLETQWRTSRGEVPGFLAIDTRCRRSVAMHYQRNGQAHAEQMNNQLPPAHWWLEYDWRMQVETANP